MPEICTKCGLPKEICVCGEISKEQAKIVVTTDRRRYRKYMTIIEGVGENGKEVMKKLKAKLACGGTFKNGTIELQGNHQKKIKDLLVEQGFPEASIEVK